MYLHGADAYPAVRAYWQMHPAARLHVGLNRPKFEYICLFCVTVFAEDSTSYALLKTGSVLLTKTCYSQRLFQRSGHIFQVSKMLLTCVNYQEDCKDLPAVCLWQMVVWYKHAKALYKTML